jgi:hypothetical protein
MHPRSESRNARFTENWKVRRRINAISRRVIATKAIRTNLSAERRRKWKKLEPVNIAGMRSGMAFRIATGMAAAAVEIIEADELEN